MHVFPFAGLPKKIISDRDPQFTSTFFKELCKQLDMSQNLSTAYHPQTDGQLEKMNQHIEMALWIYCNYQQNNWAQWLPIVQYAINTRPSATTERNHRMYKVSRSFSRGRQQAGIIFMDNIVSSIHLFPRFTPNSSLSEDWNSFSVLESCDSFYANPFSDRDNFLLFS
jgi:transposase InsO family protein